MANRDEPSPEDEAALVEKRRDLLDVSIAEAALENAQIVAYFEEVRARAVEAMLNPNFDTDEQTLWRMRASAQVVDGLFKYLKEKRDMRAFIEVEIKALEGN